MLLPFAMSATRLAANRRAGERAPQSAGDVAYHWFCRPDLSPWRPVDHTRLVARARVHLTRGLPFTVDAATGPVRAYAFEPASPRRQSRTHVLVHGWASEAAFMAAFIEPLRFNGDRVIAFDLPAHGRSPGPLHRHAASLIDCARAAQAVCEHPITLNGGTVHSLIGHSLGAMVAALLVEGGVPLGRPVAVQRVVLLAAPNRVADVTRRFGAQLALSSAAQRRFESHVERVGQRALTTFSVGRLLSRASSGVLVIHARDDAIVPYDDAIGIQVQCPAVRLVPVDHLGHAGVLYAPPVVRHVRDFVTAD